MLLKAISKADSSNELKVLESNFRGDFDRNQLESELHVIPAIFKQSTSVDFCEICKTFQEMDEEKRPMIKNRTYKWCDISQTRTLFFNAEENQNLA